METRKVILNRRFKYNNEKQKYLTAKNNDKKKLCTIRRLLKELESSDIKEIQTELKKICEKTANMVIEEVVIDHFLEEDDDVINFRLIFEK